MPNSSNSIVFENYSRFFRIYLFKQKHFIFSTISNKSDQNHEKIMLFADCVMYKTVGAMYCIKWEHLPAKNSIELKKKKTNVKTTSLATTFNFGERMSFANRLNFFFHLFCSFVQHQKSIFRIAICDNKPTQVKRQAYTHHPINSKKL